jgi:hypothetical protein
MERQTVHWNGTDQERDELLAALDRDCSCSPPQLCAAHALLHDQRRLDALLFARRIRERLLSEESGQ